MIYDHNTNRLYFMGVTVTDVSEQNYSYTTVDIYPNPANGNLFIY